MPDDDEILDTLFERALSELEAGRTPSVDVLLDGRESLRPRAEALLRRARRIAVVRPRAEPIRVAGYRVLELLGQGGMGAVYLARQERLAGRLVALKILPAGSALSPRARARFRSEANGLASLRHPNVIPVYDVVDDADVHAYAMERVDGPSLARLIETVRAERDRPAIDVARSLFDAAAVADRTYAVFVCRIGVAIARALGAVHRAGLLHRDVKPSNILLRRDGTPLLSDFGLAREADSSHVTQSGHFAGTPAYAAPEQLRGEATSLGPRADVYALGVTLYHALALETPFDGRTPGALLRAIEAGRAVPLRRRDPRLSADLETIVAKAMDADPERRYATADDLADDLERLLSLQPILARPSGLATRLVKLARRNRRSLAAAVAGAVAALVLAVAFVAWWFLVPRWVEEHVAEARLALLDPAQGTGLFGATAWSWPDAETSTMVSTAALDAALASYAKALRFSGQAPDLRLERDVVEWVRRRDEPDRAAGPMSRIARAAPLAAEGAGAEAVPEERLATATAAELRALGLLSFLAGRVERAVAAWTRLELLVDSDPFVEAALGQTFLVRAEPARAYPRLRRAVEAFPGVGFLAVSFADAALRSGDVAKARRTLDAARGMTRQDPFRGLERVEGDLRVAAGDFDGALLLYEAAEPTNPYARFRHAQLLERLGKPLEALRRYAACARVGEWSEPTRALVGAAERWWDALGHGERFAVLLVALDEPATLGESDGIVSILRAYRLAVGAPNHRTPPDFAALAAGVSSPSLRGGSLSALTERMEVTNMSSWMRWRSTPAFLKRLLVGAWLSPRPEEASAVVDRLGRAWRWAAAAFLYAAASPSSASAQGTFQGLGDLPGGAFGSYADKISADGTTVIGQGTSAIGAEVFLWRADTGMINLGHLPGPIVSATPHDLSADGETVVGYGYSNNAHPAEPFEAFIWTEGTGMQPLGDLPGGRYRSEACTVTADGTRVFGSSTAEDERHHACEWTVGGGITDLLILPGSSHIYDTTSDGTTLVGAISNTGTNGIRWTESGGLQNLGELPGGEVFCALFSVSEDGETIVGQSGTASGREGVYWTQATGLVGLGDFPGGVFESDAIYVASDASLIGGYGISALGIEAAVWTPGFVMTRASDHLAAQGVVVPAGWQLQLVLAINVGCDTISLVGSALNPSGDREAWLATYPNPSALGLRKGNVDTGAGGPPFDVMKVNGSAGDPVERKVTVAAGVPTTISIAKAPMTSGPKGGYGFWIYDGDLRGCEDILIKKSSDGSILTLGQANGCMPINNTVAAGSCPCPLTFPIGKTAGTMTAGKAALLCLKQPPAPKSPTSHSVRFPAGTFTILSVHLDRNAPASPEKNISIGNTIVVVAQP